MYKTFPLNMVDCQWIHGRYIFLAQICDLWIIFCRKYSNLTFSVTKSQYQECTGVSFSAGWTPFICNTSTLNLMNYLTCAWYCRNIKLHNYNSAFYLDIVAFTHKAVFTVLCLYPIGHLLWLPCESKALSKSNNINNEIKNNLHEFSGSKDRFLPWSRV